MPTNGTWVSRFNKEKCLELSAYETFHLKSKFKFNSNDLTRKEEEEFNKIVSALKVAKNSSKFLSLYQTILPLFVNQAYNYRKKFLVSVVRSLPPKPNTRSRYVGRYFI